MIPLALSLGSLGISLYALLPNATQLIANQLKKAGKIEEDPNSMGYTIRQSLQREFEVCDFMTRNADVIGLSRQEQVVNRQVEQTYRWLESATYFDDWNTQRKKYG
jgi:hypothetical protein